jgi:hypothetical protein
VIWPTPDQHSAECIVAQTSGIYSSSFPAGGSLHFEHCRAWQNYDYTQLWGMGEMSGGRHSSDRI